MLHEAFLLIFSSSTAAHRRRRGGGATRPPAPSLLELHFCFFARALLRPYGTLPGTAATENKDGRAQPYMVLVDHVEITIDNSSTTPPNKRFMCGCF